MAENEITETTANDTGVADPVETGGGDEKDWKAEAEKWKTLSRKHESREKDLLKELDAFKQASMSDAEKALENARREGETSGLKKASERLVKAELKAMAAEKGVTLPDLDALNLTRFAGEDGEPDEKAIEKFVNSLGGSNGGFADPKDLGIGRTGGASVRQWTRADLQGKSHEEIFEARQKGHLDQLLGR